MGYSSKIKKIISNILIAVGLLIFAVPQFIEYDGKYNYAKTSDEDNEITVGGEAEDNLDVKKEIPLADAPDEAVKNATGTPSNKGSSTSSVVISRKDYKNGMMTISIPKIKVKAPVMQGTSKSYLKKGPGLYEISPLPVDDNANVCIAAHRNAYGQWFRNIDKLAKGDKVILEFNKERYTYSVERVFIVEKDDWSVTKPAGYSVLTLTSCHPLKPPYKRIIARAKLIEKRDIIDTN